MQPDVARARALRRKAARVLALREGLQPALHARHTRTVPQRCAAVHVRAVRTRLRGQGTAVHAPQDHLHLAPATPAGYVAIHLGVVASRSGAGRLIRTLSSLHAHMACVILYGVYITCILYMWSHPLHVIYRVVLFIRTCSYIHLRNTRETVLAVET